MKKYYPKIKFGLNIYLEKKFFNIFSNDQKAIRPELRFLLEGKFSRTRDKFLSAYTDNYYKIHSEDIMREIKKTEKSWKKVEKYFFHEVDRLFNGYPWPKGKYFGYASIWRMFPRFIKMKTFAFPAEPKNFRRNITTAVIAHEMLHFITYDYLQKKYKLKPGECCSKDKTFWCFTENLNVLIENEKIWHKFTGGEKNKPYLECQPLYFKMKKIWDKNKNLDNLIVNIFRIKNESKRGGDPGKL